MWPDFKRGTKLAPFFSDKMEKNLPPLLCPSQALVPELGSILPSNWGSLVKALGSTGLSSCSQTLN